MRLIDTETLELHEFWGDAIPEYAILSHTWEEGEVTFQDWRNLSTEDKMKKRGYFKVGMACRQAQKHCLKYLWVDTNCIDKSSSAELSEAINSMFSWYQNASVCYVYLSDVKSMPNEWHSMTDDYVKRFYQSMTDDYVKHFCQSKWLTRGWTLQELLAPTAMTFFSQDWSQIASRSLLEEAISKTTRISIQYLQGDGQYKYASIAQKMSWIARRSTTRIEDMAYCMLGIFDINMPLLYGEEPKSFTRLQEEIIRTSNDQTIFCWTWIDSVPPNWTSLLAPCPQAFKYSENFVTTPLVLRGIKHTYKMTNAGLSINLLVAQAWCYYLGILNAKLEFRHPRGANVNELVCVPIKGHLDEGPMSRRHAMRRIQFPPGPVPISTLWALCQSHLYVHSNPGLLHSSQLASSTNCFERKKYSFLLVFGDTEKLLDERFRSDTIKSEVSPGTRVCLLERTRRYIKLDVFPPDIFDQERGLITIGLTIRRNGFLIRISTDSCSPRVLFIGTTFRFEEVFRFCKVVPETFLKETSDEDELLKRLFSWRDAQMGKSFEGCNVSWGQDIGILMREETIAGIGLICLIYITCEDKLERMVESESDDDSDTRSDVAVQGGDHDEQFLSS